MTDQLDERTYDLLFAIRRSVRYHMHRRRFYELWNAVTVTIAVVGGSSAATAFFAKLPEGLEWVPSAFAGTVALFAAVDLAVGTARRGDKHGDTARQFIGLEQRFAHGRCLDDTEHEDLIKARLQIEASELPVLRLLDVLCHFELLRSLGDTGKHPRVPWVRRLLAHWASQTTFALSLAPTAPE